MALYDLMPAKDSPALALFSRVFMIWPIKLLLPLTILRLILAYSTHPHLHHSYLDIHAALEILLFIHYLVKRHVLTARPAAAHSYVYPKIDRQTPLPPLKHLKQCLSHIKASLPDPRDASRRQQDIANWFIDLDQGRTNQIPTFSQIHRTQAATWLSWAFWDSPLTPTLLLETAPLVDAMEAWAGAKFEATATPTHNVKPLTLTLDPPRCQVRVSRVRGRTNEAGGSGRARRKSDGEPEHATLCSSSARRAAFTVQAARDALFGSDLVNDRRTTVL